MGRTIEFNWILKLDDSQIDLNPPKGFQEFIKEGSRIYPLQKSIFLVNQDWKAVASVYIRNYEVNEGFTKGDYIIEKRLDDYESKILSNLFREMYSNKSKSL